MALVSINPKRIPGGWRQGFVLDYHTLRSEFLGYDEFGHQRFDTTRSEIGDLLYKLKYQDDRTVLGAIVETAAGFIRGRNLALDFIVPVPASRARAFQPVLELAKELSRVLGVPLCDDCIIKVKETPQLKNVYDYDLRLKLLEDAYTADPGKLKRKSILLFDDLYRSGATLNAMTAAAYGKGEADNVYALALTKTRSMA